MTFQLLGNFLEVLPYAKIWEHINSTSDWDMMCSPNDWKKSKRPAEDKSLSLYFTEENALHATTIVKDKNFFNNDWFELIGADNSKPYQAKIFWTLPGNFEPPHIDYYPSFIGRDLDPDTLKTLAQSVIRVWIPLQDSEFGQMLYSEDEVLHKWKMGDAFSIPSGVSHGFANGGHHARYVLVFTGWKKSSLQSKKMIYN
jgi:hypothetical protein